MWNAGRAPARMIEISAAGIENFFGELAHLTAADLPRRPAPADRYGPAAWSAELAAGLISRYALTLSLAPEHPPMAKPVGVRAFVGCAGLGPR